MSRLPDLDQIRRIPAVTTREVTDDLIDDNGHMNITHYFRGASLGMWALVKGIGAEGPYLTERRLTFFTAEHHLAYLGELRLGEQFSVHPQFLERGDKVVHGFAYVVDDTHDRVACTFEVTFVHVSMDDRRAVPIPDDVAAAADLLVAAHADLAPLAPVCGSMGLRRKG